MTRAVATWILPACIFVWILALRAAIVFVAQVLS